MTRNKFSLPKLFIATGILLMLMAAAALAFVTIPEYAHFRDNETITARLEAVMPERHKGIEGERHDPSLPQINCDGSDYVGIIQINSKSVTLPILSSVDRAAMPSMVCLVSGSPYDSTLVVCGGSSVSCLAEISTSCEISVTDVRGAVFSYEVEKIFHSDSFNTDDRSKTDYDFIIYYKKPFSGCVIACCSAK